MLTEVTVGLIGRAHGVAGEVYVDARTDEPERRFTAGQVLQLRPGSGGAAPADRPATSTVPSEVTLRRARRHQHRWLATFEEVADRESAEALRGMALACQVPTDEEPAGENEYYDRQLIGLSVHCGDTGGRPVGTVRSVLHEAGQDILETQVGEEVRLVPFVTALVPEIDLTAGTLTVADVPGLLFDGEAAGDAGSGPAPGRDGPQ